MEIGVGLRSEVRIRIDVVHHADVNDVREERVEEIFRIESGVRTLTGGVQPGGERFGISRIRRKRRRKHDSAGRRLCERVGDEVIERFGKRRDVVGAKAFRQAGDFGLPRRAAAREGSEKFRCVEGRRAAAGRDERGGEIEVGRAEVDVGFAEASVRADVFRIRGGGRGG